MPSSLVTGGAGFIGSHLAELLLARGDEVVVLDDLSTGSRDNLAHLRDNPRLKLVVESVLEDRVVEHMVFHADRVFHLAAAVGVKLIVEQPARVIETNILGTASVLHACRRHGKPLFLASTSEVCGKSAAASLSEEADMVLGPTSKTRWAYACSKAIDEFMGLAFAHDYGLPIVIGRFFNTTGPRQTGQYGMVVPRFVDQALAGAPITVYGSGEQSRCFAHVADVVAATVALVETPAAYGQVVNLGNDQPVTVGQLARRVKELTGSPSAIVQVPFEEAYGRGFEDIASRRPDLAKARALIGYAPRHGLDDILRDVIASRRPPNG